MDKKPIEIPRPYRKTSNNEYFRHIYLNDRQYQFCLYYAFGLPFESRVVRALTGIDPGEDAFLNEDELFFKKYDEIIDNYLPRYRGEKSDPMFCFKYKYNNGLGSYMLAYRCKNYETAKTNSKRLLENPYIILELYLMKTWLTKVFKQARFYAMDEYKTKLSLDALESGRLILSDNISINDFMDRQTILIARYS